MPAITVDDLTVLPRLKSPGLGDQPRPVWQVSTAPQGYEGEGFPVRRAFAGIDLAHLDPFIMMDQMGEVEYAPGEPKGTPWHPHRGFETVTYIIDGTFDHQDSHGGGGTITNGDTQWMTAGSGILHIEAPPEWLVQSGGLFHGLQLWVNLPRDAKLNDPKYQDIRWARSASPRRTTAARWCASSPVRSTACRVPAPPSRRWRSCTRPWSPAASSSCRGTRSSTHSAYVLAGKGKVGTDGRPVSTGQAVVFGAGDYLTITADGCQESRRRARRRRGRWPPDPGAAGIGRPVRDEHEGRGAGGLRGLPEGPLRAHPRPALIRR